MAGKKVRAFTGVLYPDSTSYDCEEKLRLLEGVFNKWAYVLHDKDVWTEEDEKNNSEHKAGTLKKSHYHWVGYKNNGVYASTVAKAMSLPENDIEIAKFGWRSVCRYLTHIDYEEKTQYKVQDCTSNFNLQIMMDDEVSPEEMAKNIFTYLLQSGCSSTSQLVKWSFDNGCWSELRRSFSLWQSVMQENKQDFRDLVEGAKR